jgi:hypothetical protein
MPDGWINFWSFFFFLSLSLFVLLSVAVIIGGFFNILSLLRTISEGHKSTEDAQSPAENMD